MVVRFAPRPRKAGAETLRERPLEAAYDKLESVWHTEGVQQEYPRIFTRAVIWVLFRFPRGSFFGRTFPKLLESR